MANPQCLPCNASQTIQGKWNLQGKPPPELVEGEEVYNIETIQNHRKQGQGYQYYVQWHFQCLMGTRTCIFWWWQHTGWIQKMPLLLIFLLSPSGHMFPYQQYNMDKELLDWLEIIYDLIDFLDDIRLALEMEEDWFPLSTDLLTPSKPLESIKLSTCLHPPLTTLLSLPSCQLSLSKNILIWLQTWEWFPFIMLFI